MPFSRRIIALWCALILFVLIGPQQAKADSIWDDEPPKFSVELGFDVATGKFGNTTSTTTVSVPLSLAYYVTPRFDLGLSIPYLWQSNTFVVGGKPVRMGKAAAAPTGVPGQNMNPGMMMNGATSAQQKGEPVDGVGDLVLSAGYTLFPEQGNRPEFRPVVGVKIPTAQSGLGTGAVDVTAGFTSSKWLDNWYLYLGGDYTVQGKTSLHRARNYFDYDLGVGYEILPGLRPAVGVKGATPTEEGTGAVVQVEGKVVYILNRHLAFKLYLDRGLSVSAADWQGGCSLGFNF